ISTSPPPLIDHAILSFHMPLATPIATSSHVLSQKRTTIHFDHAYDESYTNILKTDLMNIYDILDPVERATRLSR
ncbi:hypothetical protein KI387_043228, partial [Taxus chinensis]